MVLSFKPQFKPLILSGEKIHTLREDANCRWKPGMIAHMATGVRTKNYQCFAEKKIVSIQNVSITPHAASFPRITVDGWEIYPDHYHLSIFAKNDGFSTYHEMFEFFGFGRGTMETWQRLLRTQLRLRLLHWTDFKY